MPTPSAGTPAISGPYALIAESNPKLAALFARLLTEDGLRSVIVTDGEAALRALHAPERPRLVIVDLCLAKWDGFAVLAALRQLAPVTEIPAVVTSAFQALRVAASGFREALGVVGLLTNRDSADAVQRTLRQALSGVRRYEDTNRDPDAQAKRERVRLEHLAATGLVNEKQPPDPALQALVAETAGAFGVPMAAISFMREHGSWFKAFVGIQGTMLQNRGMARMAAPCRHVVQADTPEPLIVPDLTRHPCFADNPLAQSGEMRSYAGAPLITPQGDVLGSLCIMDTRPLTLGAPEVAALMVWARRAMGALELASAAARRHPAEARHTPPPQQGGAGSFTAALPYLRSVFGSLEAGVFILGPNRRTLFANPLFASQLGMGEAAVASLTRDAIVKHVGDMVSKEDGFQDAVAVLPTGAYALRATVEILWPTRRVIRWVEQPVQLPLGVAQLGIWTDVTAETDLALERERVARTDVLTGLANRRGGEENITREVARAHRLGTPLCFVYFDVNNFKRVNDLYGHASGDKVLKKIAELVAKTVRGVDFAVRWGGEELLAVLSGSAVQGGLSLAERIRVAVQNTTFDDIGQVTLSGGVAELLPGEGAAEAIGRADSKLYEAKRAGGNQIR